MIKAVTVNVLTMTDYFGATADARDYILPDVPAFYIWTVDLQRLARLQAEHAKCEVNRILSSPRRWFVGRMEPFYTVNLSDAPRPLSADKVDKFEKVFRNDIHVIKWILLSATVFQRPLYVGKTRNLKVRIQDHVRPGSPFRSYVDEANLGIQECALAYMETPETDRTQAELTEVQVGDVVEEDGEFEVSVGPPVLDVVESLLQVTLRPLFGRQG